MADTKISAMTAATTLGDTDELVLNVSGANKKITGANLKASVPGSTLTLLSTTTRATDGTFNVSSISGAYNDLILLVIARGTTAAALETLILRFNNDSAANYAYQYVRGQATTASANSNGATASPIAGHIASATGTANEFGMTEILIPGYASTTWLKHATARSGPQPQDLFINAITWTSTAAINRVQIFGGSTANLLTGSVLRIYGRL